MGNRSNLRSEDRTWLAKWRVRMRMGKSFAIVTALSILSGGLAFRLRAQDAGSASGTNAQHLVSEKQQSVNIYFSARDGDGKIVTDLKADELMLTVDGAPHQIDAFLGPEGASPLTLDLLLDVSGSRREELPDVEKKYAKSFFTALLRPSDLAYVREFRDTSRLLAISSGDPAVLAKAVGRESQGFGPTALFRAVYVACTEDFVIPQRRKAILLITDGDDNQAGVSPDEVENCLRKQNVVVYAIRTIDPLEGRYRMPEGMSGSKILGHLTDYSGGYVWPVHDEENFADVLTAVTEQIRGQYTIGFTGPAPKPNGKPHKLELKTSRKGIILFAPEYMPDGEPLGP